MKVRLNGTDFGFLTTTPNNGTGPTELTIPAAQQMHGINVITFVNSNATWLWGGTDILVEPAPIV